LGFEIAIYIGKRVDMIELILAIMGLIGGIILIAISSDKAVKHSAILAKALGVSSLVIGVTIVSIGTDLSEIFNSIISCSLGHGDIDVGDSVGSDLTQLTLVFGLLPFCCGGFKVKRKEIITLGACEILSLILIYSIVEKGYITRINAIFMVGSLPLYIFIIYHTTKDKFLEEQLTFQITVVEHKKRYHASIAAVGFVGITISAYMIVQSTIIISSYLNVHEYIISFFLVSFGTSLPELAVDISALRRREHNIAIGDVIGSCIVDSTLSIGIGQVLFPQSVTASLAIPTITYTLFASFIVFILIAYRKKVDKKAGAILISLYAFSFLIFFPLMFS